MVGRRFARSQALQPAVDQGGNPAPRSHATAGRYLARKIHEIDRREGAVVPVDTRREQLERRRRSQGATPRSESKRNAVDMGRSITAADRS
jgi:hypothetical protein